MPPSKLTRVQKKTQLKTNPKKYVPSLGSLDAVSLPPPSSASDGGYAWIHEDESNLRKRDTKRATMLKTPESIVRSTDDIPSKRVAILPLDSNKRPRNAAPNSKMAQAPEDYSELRMGRNDVFMNNNNPDNNSVYDWNTYVSSAQEVRPDRPRSVPATFAREPLYYEYTGDPLKPSVRDSWPAHTTQMLSPNSPRHNFHLNNSNHEFTPTRAERPQSASIDMSHYEMVIAQRNAAAILMPLHHGILPPRSLIHGRSIASQPAEDDESKIPSPENMPPVPDDGDKPTFSYAMLIGMAILRAPGRKLTLSQIYTWITQTFAYYRNSKPSWHNSIRHNLSLNKAFEKRVRPKDEPGKGSYWTIKEGCEHQFCWTDKKVGFSRPYKFPGVLSNDSRPTTSALSATTDEVVDAFTETAELLTRKTSGPSQTKYMIPADVSCLPGPVTIDRTVPGELKRVEKRKRTKARAESAPSNHVSLPMNHNIISWEPVISNDIPSDGTEPDDRLTSDREKRTNHLSPELVKVFTKRSHQSLTEQNFPQMHAMSTTSSQVLPSHQELSTSGKPSDTLDVNVNGSASITNTTKASLTHSSTSNANDITNITASFPVARFATTNLEQSSCLEASTPFRCSTPSLVRGNQANMLLDGLVAPKVPSIHASSPSPPTAEESFAMENSQPPSDSHNEIGDKYPQLKAPKSPLRQLESPCKSSTRNNIVKELNKSAAKAHQTVSDSLASDSSQSMPHSDELPSLSHTDATTSSFDSGHSSVDDPLDILRTQTLPRTPIRELRKTTLIPSTNKRRVQFLRPAMLHYQSLESPYAGTLELSPGVPRLEAHHISSNLYQNRQVFCNVADFLDMDMPRSDLEAEKPTRLAYDFPVDSTPIAGTAAQHTPASAVSTHAHAFSLDIENSPKMVVTPLRRPFDTPIRDVSHTFSPYYKAANVGSPIRRR